MFSGTSARELHARLSASRADARCVRRAPGTSLVQAMDTNGDGLQDAVGLDTNGDGLVDTYRSCVLLDTNGDLALV